MRLMLYFIVAGIFMYILDTIFLRVWKNISLIAYLFSGIVVGAVISQIFKMTELNFGIGWIMIPITTICGSLFLFIFAKFHLYRSSFFQIFGTISLGIATGFSAWILMKLVSELLKGSWLFLLPDNLWLNLIIYSFLLHFGYAFTGRIHRQMVERTKKT